jgi:hypothetical protein
MGRGTGGKAPRLAYSWNKINSKQVASQAPPTAQYRGTRVEGVCSGWMLHIPVDLPSPPHTLNNFYKALERSLKQNKIMKDRHQYYGKTPHSIPLPHEGPLTMKTNQSLWLMWLPETV